MALPPEDKINAAIVQLEEDTGYLHRFRAGGETEKVPVEAGDIPTLSGLVAEIRADSAVATTEAVQAATAAELAASQAHVLSVEARDAANAANTASQSANNRAAAAEKAAVDAADAAGSVVDLLDNKVDKLANHTLYPAADKNKLASIAVGATKNQSDAVLKDRANHTGTQAISTIDGLETVLSGLGSEIDSLESELSDKVSTDDSRLSDARDWLVEIVPQEEAEAGVSTNARKWTAERVRQAIMAALDDLGSGGGPRPIKDHGPVATSGSQTVVCNVQESDFHIMDMSGANSTGTLTIDFANMPDTVGKHFSWHVRLRRGGRKTVEFAQAVTWAGGVKPNFGTGTNSHDLIMFYKVDNETIRAMVIDAWG